MDMEGSQSIRIVLHNLELLEEILQYLSRCKKSLVSASLTAKAFSEPAFNVLWYEMESLEPLFRILPTFERGTNGKYEFTGPIRNEHLQRVLYYAKHVRCLHYKDVDLSPNARALMVSTLVRMDKLGAFVRLRKIHLHYPLHNVLPLTLPNLDSVEIKTKKTLHESTEIGTASFLQSITQPSHLRSLTINGPFSDITTQFLPDFTNLHRLSMYLRKFDVPVHFLKRIASSMSSLRHLLVNIDGSCSSPPNDRPQGHGQPHSIFRPSFPSLETLDLTCSPAHLENLLGVLDAPLLKSVTLKLLNLDVGALLPKFFERNQILKDQTDKLAIDSKTVGQSLDFVQSFKKLGELLVVYISMSDIVDTFSYEGSWSHSLKVLNLIQMDSENPVNSISITTLCLIADTCPALESLSISIHHPEKPEKQTAKNNGKGRKPHNLKRLLFFHLPDVWDDTMSLAIDLVSLLVHLFPAMDVLDYFGKNGARQAWWKGVQDMWRMCQTIRDERNVEKPA